LPPSARFGTRGIIEVHERAFAPHAFVFVSEQRLLDPVRPTTVIVNNTTIINQTVNITKVQVVRQTVINEGPRPETIERRSGRRIETVPVRELRRKEETEVVAKRQNSRSNAPERAPASVRSESAPVRAVPVRDRGRLENPSEARTGLQPETRRNETRKPAEQGPTPNVARPELKKRSPDEGRPESTGQTTKPVSAEPVPGTKQDGTPGNVVPSRDTRRVQTPSQTAHQPTVGNNPVRTSGETNSAAQVARPGATRQPGNERQRELEHSKVTPESERPGAASKTTPAPTNKQVEKRKVPTKEKPAAKERAPKNAKKKEEGKKGEEQQTQPPPASSRSP